MSKVTGQRGQSVKQKLRQCEGKTSKKTATCRGGELLDKKEKGRPTNGMACINKIR
jgi:hypothetical protein